MTPDNFSSVNLEKLRVAGNWQAQYRLLMAWGQLVQKKEALRTDNNRLKGCAIPAWLAYIDGEFYFDSDSRIINGLAALLLAVTSRHDSANLSPVYWSELLRELGLERHLTPSRNNGFKALVQRVYTLASDV